MKKTLKLKKNYEFNRTFKKGTYFSGKQIEGFYLKNGKNINYIGIAISSKICNAINRNKIKRRIREAYQTFEEKIQTGYTFVFLWKRKIKVEECTYDSVCEDMEHIFKKIGLWKDE